LNQNQRLAKGERSAVEEPIADIHLGDGGNSHVFRGAAASPKTMPKLIAEGANIGGKAALLPTR
jgi:hypothetical protein